MTERLSSVACGTRVLTSDGVALGSVIGVQPDVLVISQGWFLPRTLFVPALAVAATAAGEVIVAGDLAGGVPAAWRLPPAPGSPLVTDETVEPSGESGNQAIARGAERNEAAVGALRPEPGTNLEQTIPGPGWERAAAERDIEHASGPYPERHRGDGA